MLKHRLISFVVLLSLFCTIVFVENFYVSTFAAAILALPMSYFAVYEFLNMTENIGYGGFKKIGGWLAVIFTLCYIVKYGLVSNIPVPYPIFAVFFWFMILKNISDKDKLKRVLMTAVAFFMIMAPLSFVIEFLFQISQLIDVKGNLEFVRSPFSKMVLLYIILVTKAGDTGAYCTGMICNKLNGGKNHPVVPKVSPKKSIEGVIGGIFLSVVVSYLFLMDYNIKMIILGGDSKILVVILPLFYGVLLYFGGFFGDLVESSLKRTCGVKDSGNILPGMGGVLDVVDSLLVAVPVFILVRLLINNVIKLF
ncbi:phosphatidate cytidylyltransferase [Lentisphaerota bacterium WC36G]|nr:phosphatidate cytidylyltransferase [Lentisphaerae bacterium WC36]